MSKRIIDLRITLDAALATAPDDCWLWPTGGHPRDYGRVAVDGRAVKAHRHVWSLYHGPIAAGLMVLHHCDTVGCVNPHHLYLGSHADNMRDKATRQRGHNIRATNAQVAEARVMRANGAAHKDIAAKFGMSLTWSVRVCNGERRQHVTTRAVTSD